MRIVFAGTPEFAAQHLQALLDSQHAVVAVYTQPDRPAGRGKKLQPSAVKTLALQHDLPVYQPQSLKPAEQQQALARLNADVMVVVAYGLLLPQTILDTPALGCINVHGSLLPRWRGAAPIQRAIWAGDTESGVAVMQMEAGLDTGPVLLEQRCKIDADETSASLYEKLEALGPPALIKTLDHLPERLQQARPQNSEQASYAKKLSKEEGRIDWQQDAQQLNRNVHAFNPWPTAWFVSSDKDGKQVTIKVLKSECIEQATGEQPGTIVAASTEGIDVACGTGVLRIIAAQMPGKKVQPAAVLLNGYSSIFSKGNQLT
ncbi:MAG: methionyl-tRNA formyltransferase [Pseudomonadota bacterium]